MCVSLYSLIGISIVLGVNRLGPLAFPFLIIKNGEFLQNFFMLNFSDV